MIPWRQAQRTRRELSLHLVIVFNGLNVALSVTTNSDHGELCLS
jgi:hypothetical protein